MLEIDIKTKNDEPNTKINKKTKINELAIFDHISKKYGLLQMVGAVPMMC